MSDHGATMDGGIVIFVNAVVACSVCAPKALTAEDVVKRTTGLLKPPRRQWAVRNVGDFVPGGSHSPSPCNQYPGTRQHWFLVSEARNA